MRATPEAGAREWPLSVTFRRTSGRNSPLTTFALDAWSTISPINVAFRFDVRKMAERKSHHVQACCDASWRRRFRACLRPRFTQL